MKTAVVKGIVSAVCAVLAALGLWHSAGARGAAGPPSPAAEKKSPAKELFDQRCARCHGRDGRGETRLGEMLKVPDFTDEGWWRGDLSDERLKTSIAQGKGEMPAFGKKLSRTEISSLVGYVRSLKSVKK